MSSYTLNHLKESDLLDRLDSLFIKAGDRILDFDDFMVGKPLDATQLFALRKLGDILCEEDCRVNCDRKYVLEKLNNLIIKNEL